MPLNHNDDDDLRLDDTAAINVVVDCSIDVERIGSKTSTTKHQQQSKTAVLEDTLSIRFKKFEQVIASILSSSVNPQFVQLPPPPIVHNNNRSDNGKKDDWPYNVLPSASRVSGHLDGQLANPIKAIGKEHQVRSMIRCILSLLQQQENEENPSREKDKSIISIVDFGGGSGHLSIPLALLLHDMSIGMNTTKYNVICVDLNQHSLGLLHGKANDCPVSVHNDLTNSETNTGQSSSCYRSHGGRIQQCRTIPNLYTFHGSIDDYATYISDNVSSNLGLDVAVALHLCGEATDVVLRLAITQNVYGIVVAPCCVGKMQAHKKNPYSYQATGQNIPTISYPQSTKFCQLLNSSTSLEDNNHGNWNALAKAADYSDIDESRTNRNAARRTAKALLETDRRLYIEEQSTNGLCYQTVLTRMVPWEATPKNDIIIAWQKNKTTTNTPSTTTKMFTQVSKGCILANLPIDVDCQADIQITVEHLLGHSAVSSVSEDVTRSAETCNTNVRRTKDDNRESSCFLGMTLTDDRAENGVSVKTDRATNIFDWSREEEAHIQNIIFDFLNNNESSLGNIYIFPVGMGGRQRKIIHFVAEQMNLKHWGVGSKKGEKTVSIARKRVAENK